MNHRSSKPHARIIPWPYRQAFEKLEAALRARKHSNPGEETRNWLRAMFGEPPHEADSQVSKTPG
jgi:hypothetical protein